MGNWLRFEQKIKFKFNYKITLYLQRKHLDCPDHVSSLKKNFIFLKFFLSNPAHTNHFLIIFFYQIKKKLYLYKHKF